VNRNTADDEEQQLARFVDLDEGPRVTQAVGVVGGSLRGVEGWI